MHLCSGNREEFHVPMDAVRSDGAAEIQIFTTKDELQEDCNGKVPREPVDDEEDAGQERAMRRTCWQERVQARCREQ